MATYLAASINMLFCSLCSRAQSRDKRRDAAKCVCPEIAVIAPPVHCSRQCVSKALSCFCSLANGAVQVDALWLDVVWRRAFAHPSPAVRIALHNTLYPCCVLSMRILQLRLSNLYLTGSHQLTWCAAKVNLCLMAAVESAVPDNFVGKFMMSSHSA